MLVHHPCDVWHAGSSSDSAAYHGHVPSADEIFCSIKQILIKGMVNKNVHPLIETAQTCVYLFLDFFLNCSGTSDTKLKAYLNMIYDKCQPFKIGLQWRVFI